MSEIFHIDILQKEFIRRSSKIQNYSLRSFARDLGISVSWLSEILKRKKGISEKKAEQLCLVLNLSGIESHDFILSVRALHGRTTEQRALAQIELQSSLAKKDSSKIFSTEEFSQISSWINFAILELLELDQCEHSPEWLAKQLHLPLITVQNALTKLKELNLISLNENKIQAVHNAFDTLYDIPSDSIQDFHRQLLQKADTALQQQSVLQREFLNMTLSFDKDKLDEAKKEIRRFQRSFADKFYPQEGPKNSVYQLSLQFFRIDHQGGPRE